jgi:uncharacterized protein (DUF1501 family)
LLDAYGTRPVRGVPTESDDITATTAFGARWGSAARITSCAPTTLVSITCAHVSVVESGSRFVTAAGYKYNQWDTHSNNDQGHRDVLVPPLDQALSTLLEDLAQRGLLESTIVLAMGEFGRTPLVNPNKGRDHWPHCWSLVLGGGGIRGGQVIGASDEKGAYVADRMVSIGDIFATIYKAMGIDWEKTYMTPIGRPIKIANSFDDKSGVPIPELV